MPRGGRHGRDAHATIGVVGEDVFVGGDEESGGAAGGVEDGFVFFGVEDFDDEVDDVARGAELAGVALGAEDGEEVFEGVAEAFGVVVGEFVDRFEEGFEGFGVAVGEVGIFEDAAEEEREVGVLGHFEHAIGVKGDAFFAGDGGGHEFGPAVGGEFLGEEFTFSADFFGLGVHVIHEFVDEGDGDLFDLGFGVGDFADEDVAGGIDAAFCFGVEHGVPRLGYYFGRER